jgi:transcription antitermination factor NusG
VISIFPIRAFYRGILKTISTMPILSQELMVYPHDVFATDELAEGRWWVFQTRAKAEKAFARQLMKSDVYYFLPTYTKTWKNGGRAFRSHLPLFPGYVFVAGNAEARLAAFATRLVIREIRAPDYGELARELRSVYAALTGDGSARPETSLPRGKRVVVVEGPYAGITGTVLEASDGLRVYVEITLLGQGVSVGIQRWMLRVLDP